jgi:hypothetical protein
MRRSWKPLRCSLLSWNLLRSGVRRSRWLPFRPRLEVLETRAVPAYVSASSIPGADGGTAMVTGDFNHDGKLDMAVADQGFNWVNVFLGNGDGTFQAPIKAATDKPVQGLTTADLNGDGNLDLVATSYNVSEACVMLGNGDGTFKLGVDYTSGGQPYQVLVADINGDGKPDILTADTTDTKIGVLWGRGDGTFLVGTPVTVPHAPVAMALGHFFGDSSKLDIAFGCSGDDTNLYIVRGNGDGTFQPAVKIEANVDTGALAAADLNGDGKLDLVDYASRDNQIQVFMGNGNGTFQAPVIYPAGSCYSSTQIQLVDIRHNGKLDLVTINPGSNDLSVYLGNGDGTFQPPTNYVVGISPDCMAIGDFNRDGMLDIAAADYMGGDFAVLQGNGNGTFQAATDVTVGSYALYASAPYDIAEGDLNHDGVPDLVVTDWRASTVNVLLGNGDGTFQPPVSYAVGTSPYGVVLADLTGDGALDILTANRDADASHDISILMGNGDGTFQPATYVADGTGTNSVAVADLNGDGKLDLAATNLNDRTLSIMFGNGNGKFQTPINYSTDIDPTQVVVADLNRDGKPDLVVNNYHGSDVGIYLNQGGGSFSVANFYNSASGGVGNQGGPVFADLTGNGILDMLNPSANWFYVALGKGDGTFQNASSVISHDNPAALVVGDMTGDNTPDVAVANGGSMNLRVFRGKGDGTFVQDAVYAGAGRSPNDLVAADLTGDGELDLAIVDSGAPTVTIMRNQSPSAVYFNLTALATPRAGVSCPFTVTAINSAGQTVTSYSGTVHFTSNDPAAVLPADVRLTNGVGTVSVTFGTSGNEYLRGRDTANSKITGTSHTFAVAGPVASPVDHFSVSAAATSTAGSSLNVTVTALDKSNQPVSAYTGTVHFTSSDKQAVLPVDYTFTSGDVGSHVFTVTLKTAGNQSVAVADAANNSKNGSASVTVNPAGVSQLSVTGFPNPATAGVAGNFTVAAEDVYGNINPSYTGTVQFSSSDPQATGLPNSVLTNGVGTFSITLKTAGAQSITAMDAAQSAIAGTDNVTVNSAAAVSLTVAGFPSSATAGSVGKITVTAFDSFGNRATGYAGTIQFTSSDKAASLPANGGLSSGLAMFNVTLKTAGTQSITATDTLNKALTASEVNITVTAAATGQFAVAGFPSPMTAGVSGTFTVTAEDAFGNFTPGYTGTVHFSSSDPGATLPDNTTLTNGTGTFSATLDKAGSQTITATDTASSLITGTSPAIVVNPAAADHLLISTPANANAGIAFDFTVSALDAFGNTATGYAGTVHLTSSDSTAVLPGDSALTNGAGTFSVTLNNLGTQTIAASDSMNGSITGISPSITVTPPPATHFALSTPPSSSAGAAFNFTVTALDRFGNTAVGYSGTVHFSSSDSGASLPADSTLTNGVGTFNATLTVAGNQTITASDTVSSTISGTCPVISVGPGIPERLVPAGPPGNAVAGVVVSPPLVVKVEDKYGNVVTSDNTDRVTVAFFSGPGTFTSSSTVTVTVSNGVATFANLVFTAGGDYLLNIFNNDGRLAPAPLAVQVRRNGPAPSWLPVFAANFTHSAEYYRVNVTAVYERYLGRAPDSAGLASWVSQMQQGLSDEHLEANFIGSAEYIKSHGGAGAGWIKGMYLDLLGRTPTPAEVDTWLQALNGGESTIAIAYGFAASAEREGLRVNVDYQQDLGRSPTPAEVQSWVDAFESGRTNEDVVAGFVGSGEYFFEHFGNASDWFASVYQTLFAQAANVAGNAPSYLPALAGTLTHSAEYYSGVVTAAYQRYLGRGPDAAGLAGWVMQMQQGLSDEHLEASFIGSAEYINSHGGAGAGWVKGMYHDLLGRTPSQAEIDGWIKALADGESTTDIAFGFAASAEREGQRVTADYQQYLGRTPTPAEVKSWVNTFVNGSKTNEDVVAGFVGSVEYFKNHNSDAQDWLNHAVLALLGPGGF